MCRILSYLGIPTLIEETLYKPDNSFIKQSYHPIYMSYLLNLAGFGLAAWDTLSNNPSHPFLYKTTKLPFYDENLLNLAKKINASCFLAHLRGVSYNTKQFLSQQNVHPFIFEGTNMVLAHNGFLIDFDKIKYDLVEFVNPDYRKYIHGTTDSEWIYAIFMSQIHSVKDHLQTNDLIKAILETLKILHRVRNKHNIEITSPVNLFITNGEFIAATRYVFDYGWQPLDTPPSTHFDYHSLWYTYGESYGFYDNEYKMKNSKQKSSIIIASEPLTEDTTSWIELPEYTLIIAQKEKDEIKLITKDISI